MSFDKEARTITVSDNGIGMSRQEVIDHIGTIAKSGTREFFQALTGDQAKDARLIGQFGVGFYSSFIVADKVTVVTRRAGLGHEHAVRWESAGEGDYTIETVERAARGTDVILHLREGEDEFLDGWRLKSIIRKYSDHIQVPIVMVKEQWDEEKKADVLTHETEVVNQASALWARPKSEITDEQYVEFYKHVAHDFEPPLAYVHAKVEGKQEYTQLLYLPAHAPFDLWDREHRHGIKLYVRRVFIMDDAEQLMPAVPALRARRHRLERSAAQCLARDPAAFARRRGDPRRIGEEGARGLSRISLPTSRTSSPPSGASSAACSRKGVGEDHANRERIAKLLRFASTHNDYRGADGVARRLRVAHEGGPGQDLLHHGRHLRCREEQPAPRDLPQERHRGAAHVRPRG